MVSISCISSRPVFNQIYFLFHITSFIFRFDFNFWYKSGSVTFTWAWGDFIVTLLVLWRHRGLRYHAFEIWIRLFTYLGCPSHEELQLLVLCSVFQEYLYLFIWEILYFWLFLRGIAALCLLFLSGVAAFWWLFLWEIVLDHFDRRIFILVRKVRFIFFITTAAFHILNLIWLTWRLACFWFSFDVVTIILPWARIRHQEIIWLDLAFMYLRCFFENFRDEWRRCSLWNWEWFLWKFFGCLCVNLHEIAP